MTETAGRHFEALHLELEDPWHVLDSWYERRKRAVTMASLPHGRYLRCFEPGCSIGALTEALADRCDFVLAADAARSAVKRARQRTRSRHNVRVECARIPEDWPDLEFDLVMLSEVGYYLDSGELQSTVSLAASSLGPGGHVVAVHWARPEPDQLTTTAQVHAALRASPLLERVVQHVERKFWLEVFERTG